MCVQAMQGGRQQQHPYHLGLCSNLHSICGPKPQRSTQAESVLLMHKQDAISVWTARMCPSRMQFRHKQHYYHADTDCRCLGWCTLMLSGLMHTLHCLALTSCKHICIPAPLLRLPFS